MQAVGVDLAFALSFPDQISLRLLLVELQQHRAVVERRYQEVDTAENGCRNRKRCIHFEGYLPEHRAGGNFEGRYSLRVPNNDLAAAAGGKSKRRAVSRLRV